MRLVLRITMTVGIAMTGSITMGMSPVKAFLAGSGICCVPIHMNTRALLIQNWRPALRACARCGSRSRRLE
jgi:hypothetical protein